MMWLHFCRYSCSFRDLSWQRAFKWVSTWTTRHVSSAVQDLEYGAPNDYNLLIVGSRSSGGTGAVLLYNNDVTHKTSYLFNCGEETQRQLQERKIPKLNNIAHIFVTHNSWKNVGGMPGLSITLQTAGKKKLTIHGPPRLRELFRILNKMVVHHTINMRYLDHLEKHFHDNFVQIHSVPIHCSPVPEEDALDNTEDVGMGSSAIAYICHINPTANLKNVIQNAMEVTQHKSEEVDYLGFIVIECPSAGYLHHLLHTDRFNRCYQNHGLRVIVHFSPMPVVNTPEYEEWMARFPKSVKHIFMCQNNGFQGLLRVHNHQIKLHRLHPAVFPLLREAGSSSYVLPDSDPVCDVSQSVIEGNSLLTFPLMPSADLVRPFYHHVVRVKKLDETEEILQQELYKGLDEALHNLQQTLSGIEGALDMNEKFPHVVFLGTSSSVPRIYRNVTSMLLRISPDQSVLLDCGEGTVGQIHRFYGSEAPKIMSTVKAVFISHMHLDHHLGLFSVLQYCRKIPGFLPLYLLSPQILHRYAVSYNRYFEHILDDFVYVDNASIASHLSVKEDIYKDLLSILGMSEIRTASVRHVPQSSGIQFTHTDGWKICFSGDTMPCDALIDLGKDSDLLIHEATVDDYSHREASLNGHSTFSQAVEVGVRMRAKFTLLTHFSARYQAFPLVNLENRNKVAIAYDFMKVNLDNVHILPFFAPALQKLFPEEYQKRVQMIQRHIVHGNIKKQLKNYDNIVAGTTKI